MGLLRMAARTAVVAGTATAVSGRVAHRQNEKWDAQEQAQYDQQQAAAAPPAPADDPNAQLENLANLLKQGHDRERLLQENHFCSQDAVSNYRVVSVAAQIKHFDSRPQTG